MKATDQSILPPRPADPPRRRGLSVRLKILLTFLLFTLLIMGVLWLVQVVFLERIYRTVKLGQLEESADAIIAAASEGNLYTTADSIADSEGLSALLYYPATGNLTRIGGTALPVYLGRPLTASDCAALYRQAEQKGGTYLTTQQWSAESPLPYQTPTPGNDSRPRPNDHPTTVEPAEDGEGIELVTYIALFEPEQGVTAALVIRTAITPISAARDTLFYVLLVMTVLVILLAVILAIFIARTVVRPIEQISRGAERLAAGDYSYRFDAGGSYREAGDLAAALNYASQELSRLDSLRRELIANVSHDLRTPLTLISGYSEVMRDLPGEITPENLQTIIDESARLTSLVNDMLEISKLQSGNLTLDPFPFSLDGLLCESVSTYQNLAACRGYHFALQIDRPVTVCGDRPLLVRAVHNLINNALTYTGEDRTVRIAQITSDTRVRVEVTDSGHGIPKEQLPDIWERYYKVDAQHRRSAVGTGLGLSIVKSVLTLHGGSFGVRSSSAGSTFWFEIPREKDLPTAS